MSENKNSNRFSYGIGTSLDAIAYLLGIKLGSFYTDEAACIDVYRNGRIRIREIFGEDISVPNPVVPPVSYGHIHCLGAELIYPEDSEPGTRPIYGSIDEAIREIKNDVKYEENKLFKRYVNLYNLLKKEFPCEKVFFDGLGIEGPITTAVLLRGQDFYIDMYDEPEKTGEFIESVTKSIISFEYARRRVSGEVYTGIADDFAALIPPNLWPRFVIPFWDMYFKGIGLTKRYAHVENLTRQHLKYLISAGIDFYSPAVSPKLTPGIIKNEITIPFDWQLYAFDLNDMTSDEVRRWVFNSFDDGVRSIVTSIFRITCKPDNVLKIKAFNDAAKEIIQRF